jgi:ankyrin repeat protein
MRVHLDLPNHKLHEAAYENNLAAATKLVHEGFDVNERVMFEFTPLSLAIMKRSYTVAIFLLSEKAEADAIDGTGRTLMHHAAVHRAPLELAEALVRAIPEGYVGQKDHHGMTALHCAAQSNAYDVAAVLLRHGVNWGERTANGRTALRLAQECSAIEVQWLLERNLVEALGSLFRT